MAVIQISKDIRGEIAEKVVEQAHPGYSKGAQGEWFVVDGQKLVNAQENRPWDPWHDNADVISVDDLVWLYGGAEQDNCEFDPTPDDNVSEEDGWEAAVMFALDYVPDSYDAADYEAR